MEGNCVKMVTPGELPQQLKNFFGNLGYRLELAEQIRAETDVFLSSRFNVFDFIEPDENRLSDIIAMLLNPKEAHAQGDIFLKELFKTMNVPYINGSPDSVLREDRTSCIQNNLRRIDVLVQFKNYAIAIENKPWDGEQKDQISDYVSHLERLFGEQFKIVFLSNNGREPSSLAQQKAKVLLGKGQLVCMSYSCEFTKWLQACIKECSSQKFQWFLRDLMDFIKREI